MNKISRRKFIAASLGTGAMGGALAAVGAPEKKGADESSQVAPNTTGMNVVFIMTDLQPYFMVGAYGNKAVDTPNLDKLADDGILFKRAYTSSPLCTPARAGIFSGLHPQVTGAWCNNTATSKNIPLMGTIFRDAGYRAAYTGKWHLEGGNYFGDGEPDGGFEPDWWYDGRRYAEDIGKEMFAAYRKAKTSDTLRKWGFTIDKIWGHRVSNRAIDFLEKVGDDPFVLAVSYDEPHSPYVAPPEYWDDFKPDSIQKRPNYNASTENKPELQQVQQKENGDQNWKSFKKEKVRYSGCNRFIDREIGRVIDTVDRLHKDDTVIIYTSDHGTHFRAHGLLSKGPTMFEETARIPFIMRTPGGSKGVVYDHVVSHVDILPTMLEVTGVEAPGRLAGKSLAPLAKDPNQKINDDVLISFNRFSKNHEAYGELYPIRAITDGRYKLAINLFDTDELYDLQKDPYEMANLIESSEVAEIRNDLHDRLLRQMHDMRDPFRGILWENRKWRHIRNPFYYNENRKK